MKIVLLTHQIHSWISALRLWIINSWIAGNWNFLSQIFYLSWENVPTWKRHPKSFGPFFVDYHKTIVLPLQIVLMTLWWRKWRSSNSNSSYFSIGYSLSGRHWVRYLKNVIHLTHTTNLWSNTIADLMFNKQVLPQLRNLLRVPQMVFGRIESGFKAIWFLNLYFQACAQGYRKFQSGKRFAKRNLGNCPWLWLNLCYTDILASLILNNNFLIMY